MGEGGLADLGERNQVLVVNGVLESRDDEISTKLYQKQQNALKELPEDLKELPVYYIPLRAYNITGLENVRAMRRMTGSKVINCWIYNS